MEGKTQSGQALFRGILSFLMPGALMFFAALLFIQQDLGLLIPVLTQVLPYLVFGIALFLGWRFDKSRLIFAAVLIALAERLLLFYGSRPDFVGRIVFDAVSVLLPLNLALLVLYQERGFLMLQGFLRLALILVQPLLVALLLHFQRFDWLGMFDAVLIGALYRPGIPLTQPALLAFTVAFGAITVNSIRHRNALEHGWFWALLTALFALTNVRPGPLSSLYLAAALLILVVGVVELSHRMAFRDELTGLPARRALNHSLLKLSNRYAIAMLDIDFFKKFNDRYGHDVGDQVLRMVASRVNQVSGGGKPFRYGGEEFTVVFPGKQLKEVLPHLEQLRQLVETSEFVIRDEKRPAKKTRKKTSRPKGDKRVMVTISIGVAERNERSAGPEDVITAADKALYRAKEAGRNRVST